jgi:flagellar P-ring protein precursor FlgI
LPGYGRFKYIFSAGYFGDNGMRKSFFILLITVFISTAVWTVSSEAARIKDLVNVDGVRANKLIGFGLVIGLANTGDQATNVFFSIQTMVNMLQKLGVTIPQNRINQLQFKNAATVMVTTELPAFARQGDRIDVVVSSLGDSRSLQGGTLLMTPVKGTDSITYAVAQGQKNFQIFSIARKKYLFP